MKVSNGTTSFVVEREGALFQVKLESTQVKEAALQKISEKVSIQNENDEWVLSYPIPEAARSLSSVIRGTKTRIEKFKLAQKLAALTELECQFKLPFLHPENIMLVKESLSVVHFGLKGLLAPEKMDEGEFLRLYKALLFNIFNPKLSFETLASGSIAMNDKFSQTLNEMANVEELTTFIDEELEKEVEKTERKLISVSKGRYHFFTYFGIAAIVLALILGWFTFSYSANSQMQNAIITAQTDFLTNNYAQTQTDLQHYSPAQLPKSARYVLAVSSVNLSDLTMAQKQAILNNISTKSDDNSLNYWVYTGRGDFNQALNLAQNLGDDQLTLLAYTNLYETTKLNSTMNGSKKQQLLDQYNKQIQSLSKSLGQ
jgi:type VII secretion protein EssB